MVEIDSNDVQKKSEQENHNKTEQKLPKVKGLFVWLCLKKGFLDKVILFAMRFDLF